MVSSHFSLVGTKIGQYLIESDLGHGGFATVWRARHEQMGRPAALKVLHAHIAEDPEIRKRFIREARVQGDIRHPNVVDVFDAGHQDGYGYIAMRLIEGDTIRRRGKLPVLEALPVFAQVASGLDAAHAKGVVHRDITPNNVLLEGSGTTTTAYVTDFGIAAIVDGTAYTPDGARLGTPSFISPEELKNDHVGPSADVFSFGCLVFYALTGYAPFPGRREVAAVATLEKVRTGDQPNVSDHDESLRALDIMVKKAMAEHPADRFPTCSQLVEALGKAIGGTGKAPGGSDFSQHLGAVGPTSRDSTPTDVVPTVLDEQTSDLDPNPDERASFEVGGSESSDRLNQASVEDVRHPEEPTVAALLMRRGWTAGGSEGGRSPLFAPGDPTIRSVILEDSVSVQRADPEIGWREMRLVPTSGRQMEVQRLISLSASPAEDRWAEDDGESGARVALFLKSRGWVTDDKTYIWPGWSGIHVNFWDGRAVMSVDLRRTGAWKHWRGFWLPTQEEEARYEIMWAERRFEDPELLAQP